MPINNYEDLIKSIEDILFYLNSSKKPDFFESIDEFSILKSLLESKDWPEAVPEIMICDDSEEDKTERSQSIIDFLNLPNNTKVLDFGCGEGHLVKSLNINNYVAFGYDIVKNGNFNWENPEGGLLTNDWSIITEESPFDRIIIYDVLDHCSNPVEVLKNIHKVCHPEAEIFCRCHPWTSPHGGHLYKKLNKAYVHLVFSEQEILQLGYALEHVQRFIFPIAAAKKWFVDSGFEILEESTIQTEVPDFFKKTEPIKKRLQKLYDGKENFSFPEFQMAQSFNDFILKKKK
jgi:2-polyprenyl-3-methyl-5-hydroxy-6-metoxy-1,4-benzoquinol methylase